MSQSVIQVHRGEVADNPHPAHHACHHDPQGAALAVAQEEVDRREEKQRLKSRRTAFYVAGRELVAALFIGSAIAKVVHFSTTQKAMADFDLPDSGLLLTLAIAVELACGAMLALGYKTRRTAVGLIAYLAAVTLLIHRNVSVDLNRSFALANLAICGGLLMLVAHGAGAFSLDKLFERRSALRSRA